MKYDLAIGTIELLLGHWTDLDAGTGCTVLLCPDGAVAAVDVRGTAPATRETDLLDPVCMVQQVHAILIGGGSAFGLAAADGVVRWLEERGYGFDTGIARVPIVPAACLFDLSLGRSDVRPDANAGYAACEAALPVAAEQGNVGAATGATVGKVLGPARATKAGFGIASREAGDGVEVFALIALNAFGHIVDPASGKIIAGPRLPNNDFADTVSQMTAISGLGFAGSERSNTTIGVIVTNVGLDKAMATKVAQMAHDGLARTTRPAHTHFDGDALFVLSCGDRVADLTLLGALAADTVVDAVLNAVRMAATLHGIPSAADVIGTGSPPLSCT